MCTEMCARLSADALVGQDKAVRETQSGTHLSDAENTPSHPSGGAVKQPHYLGHSWQCMGQYHAGGELAHGPHAAPPATHPMFDPAHKGNELTTEAAQQLHSGTSAHQHERAPIVKLQLFEVHDRDFVEGS